MQLLINLNSNLERETNGQLSNANSSCVISIKHFLNMLRYWHEQMVVEMKI
jgi:hypothetical protein